MPRQSRFLTAQWNEELGVKDSTWLTPAGKEITVEQWQQATGHCLGLLLDGRAQTSGIRRRGGEATLLLIVNAHHDVVNFMLPNVTGGQDWVRLLNTNLGAGDEDWDDSPTFTFEQRYTVTGRSLLLLLLRPTKKGTTQQ